MIFSNSPSPEQLLTEAEAVLQDMPSHESFHREVTANNEWLGRASAVIHNWDVARSVMFNHYVSRLGTRVARTKENSINAINAMLNEAIHDLRLRTTSGPTTITVNQGCVFDYYDEVRKVIEAAKHDLLFVDSYLDAEFASRYLPSVSKGVMVRLLTHNYLDKLLPAIHLFREQSNLTVEIRSSNNLHERYIFVDRATCYLSGPSFKDGPKNSPAVFMPILDKFDSSLKTYEQIWDSAMIFE